ncbi:Aste57867_13398 [Aphanomyces stellatus]|uniref:Aste57867_13398 protein n=1 Tax=Aphanomyces stellatus TaxID=120398 RepID=A0A485KZQ8_9STRA|nr:hypothetical protein As57867_013348 [Aphanomyces stellatus]VFT90237.1 Aste57867_13398 [Aphanomyces stellatus]
MRFRRAQHTLAMHQASAFNVAGLHVPFKRMQVYPVTGTIGAEVEGVDLSQPLPPDVVNELRAAFLRHGVLFFRHQHGLSPQAHLDFCRRFGPIQRHPIVQGMPGYPDIIQIVKEPGSPTRFGEEWHSDHSFMSSPPMGSVLVARELPEYGNDTLFNCMQSAYDGLSNGLQALLGQLRSVHTSRLAFSHSDRQRQANFNGTAPMQYKAGQDNTAVHPVVTVHPETGKRVLFVNPMFTPCFEGMTVDESKPILDMLFAKAHRPEFQCRFRWSPGSVAFWDNRRLQHLAINDNLGSRRVMHRITIDGGGSDQGQSRMI